ncbi:hypothetical protein GCM10022243_41000 [Saccharothrix violaceirubra]|uniref:Uncharacterized protein n=1 Tax=Saccharothrix violaceirubra TaxID=413306 RepID=A0A7W7WYU7_9PSEU|nr:hypothetical protein [Saccharothrix violaceirubra]MBB4968356.1 hypothetical protein [Saccharothrix violaceirubra]
MTAVETDWRVVWAATLDLMEADVAAAEALLSHDRTVRALPPASFTAPAGMGPLPLELRPRADAVLARQLAVAEALVVAMAATAKQAAMLGRIEDAGQAPARPGYLDCAL